MVAVNRAHWQALAEEKIVATQALLAVKQWSTAYYIAGYAVECALKSCVLLRIERTPEVIFQEKKFANEIWTHDVESLLAKAGLKADRDVDGKSDADLRDNWSIVGGWKETSRYEFNSQAAAEALFKAITDPKSGVMQWIRRRW
jgi:hypothetical protein